MCWQFDLIDRINGNDNTPLFGYSSQYASNGEPVYQTNKSHNYWGECAHRDGYIFQIISNMFGWLAMPHTLQLRWLKIKHLTKLTESKGHKETYKKNCFENVPPSELWMMMSNSHNLNLKLCIFFCLRLNLFILDSMARKEISTTK